MGQQGTAGGRGGLSDAERGVLRDSIREFLSARWPVAEAVAACGDIPRIAALWREMGAQGLASLGADSAQGGLAEIALVFEELGRASCPAPMLGAVAANLALGPERSRWEPAAGLLDALARGNAWIALALGAYDGDAASGRAQLRGGALQGSVRFVEGAAGASHFLVFTDAPGALAIVPADAPGVRAVATPGLAVPALSEVSFADAPAAVVEADAARLADVELAARLVCAARALGAAQRGFELAVEHAKVRRQFGQLIGQFQAIQHKLADCLMSIDGTRLTLEHAAQAYDRSASDWRRCVLEMLAFAGPALRAVSIQTHRALGAIGYAEEHEAPRHFRRVHADLARFGGAPRARAELAELVLGAA